MRIRHKRHLNERLDGVKDILIVADKDELNVNKAVQDKKYFDYESMFNNSNAVSIEIGCGKGGFIVEKAKRTPNENFIAVELLENIIVMASEAGKEMQLKNVKFFNCGADYLARYIKPNSIENIYLNFSPPFPHNRYENRRLTKQSLIENYKEFLVDGGSVIQKTDDKEFYEYSYSQFENNGFKVKDTSNELEGNIETEYEKKFRALNKPIYILKATK